jgi:hypothetical protein
MFGRVGWMALVLFLVGLGAAILAVGAPAIGLGEGDDFLFWKLAGLSRSSMVRLGLGLSMAVAAAALAVSMGPRVVPIVRKTAPFSIRLWAWINRDWRVAAVLAPFGLYIVVFMTTAMPGVPWIAPDSATYIGFSPTRTLLYPVLLRFLACLSDDPKVLVWPFLMLGVVATLAFAEVAQRLFRNVLVTVPAGIAILFCWSLLEHAAFVLSDYPFFAVYTLALAAALAAFRHPSRAMLGLVGVMIGVSIAIRPVGIVLLVLPVFLALVYWRDWRRLAIWLVVPLGLGLAAQMAANQAVFGFFGLSRFSGYPWAGNTALMLTPTTPVAHPELRDRIVAMAKPYQDELAEIDSAQARYIHLINTANPLIGNTGSLAMQYGQEKGIITLNDDQSQRRLVNWMNSLSPLNGGLGALPPMTFRQSIWQDGILLELGRQAHVANLDQFLSLTLLKLRFSWQSVLPWSGIGPDFSSYRTLTPGAPDLGMTTIVAEPAKSPITGVSIRGFNLVAERLISLARVVPVPGVILVSTMVGLGLVAVALARRRAVSARAAAAACLGTVTILYHLMMCVAQIPIGRFLVVVASAPSLLLFLPVAGLGWLIGRRVPSPSVQGQ